MAVVLVKYLPTIDILPHEDAGILINIHIAYWVKFYRRSRQIPEAIHASYEDTSRTSSASSESITAYIAPVSGAAETARMRHPRFVRR